MTLIGLSDKAVDAIRDRANEVTKPDHDPKDHGKAAQVLLALENRTDYGSVDFDDETLAWLEEDRIEMRQVVEENTKLIDGLAIDWEGSTGDAHYVWALEDIAWRLAQAADPSLGCVDSLEPEPRDGYEAIERVADISAEIDRLEAWWDVLEEPPVGHPEWALSCEVDSWVDGWKGLYRKVLELIAAGTIDPTEAARAALAETKAVA
jgi:hypothetical protein